MLAHNSLSKPKGNYRWGILFVIWLLYVINMMDRVSVLTLLPVIRVDLNLTHAQVGLAASVFFFGYALTQLSAGYLTDRFGAKKVMSIAIGTFSLVTFFMGLVSNFTQFIALRIGLAVGEGHHMVPAQKTIAEWFPKQEKGRAASYFTTSWTFAAVVVPLIAAAMAAALGGWRMVFYLLAIPGFIGVFFLWRYISDSPKLAFDKKQISSEEKDYIESGIVSAEKGLSLKESLKILFKDRSFIMMCLTYFCGNAVYWGNTTWLTSFIYEQHGFKLVAMGAIATLPGIAGVLSQIVGGQMVDKLFKGKVKTVLFLSFIPMAIILFSFGYIPKGNVTWLVIMLLLNGFFVNLNAVLWAYPNMRYPKEIIGSTIGVMNFVGYIGAFIAPLIAGLLVKTTSAGINYTYSFIFFAALTVAAIVFTMAMDESGPLKVDAEIGSQTPVETA